MQTSRNTFVQRFLRPAVLLIFICVIIYYASQSKILLRSTSTSEWAKTVLQVNEAKSNSTGQQSPARPLPSPPPPAEPSPTSSPSSIWEQPNLYNVPGAIPGIPAKVWQSAKDSNFTEDQRNIIGSWVEKNPLFRYELLTDGSGDSYVQTRFNETRPDIVDLYISLPIAILKADLLRYLILLADGGIWSDLDVTCEKSVGGWLPGEMYAPDAPEIGLIVGLEFDIAWQGEGSPIHSQFTNWVFAGRPGNRHLQYVVDDVVKTLYNIAKENNIETSGITLDMISDVVDVTGPKKFTLMIAESLSKMLDKKIEDKDFSKIKSPKLVGDVLVMPGMAFAGLQNGFPEDQGDKLVTHHYAGSWKGPADAARENRKKKEKEEEERKKKEEEEKKKQEEEERKKKGGEERRKEKEEAKKKRLEAQKKHNEGSRS